MDKIILGMLIIKKMTIYEMRTSIKQNMKSMCSDSLGSIQATIKKLLAKEMVVYKELVENSVNKKVYEITDIGIKFFDEWIQSPMLPGKMKNMELSKLFFMGLVTSEKRMSLIDKYLNELKKEQAYLETIEENAKKDSNVTEKFIAEIKRDLNHANKILKFTNHSTLSESLDEFREFTLMTLDYGKEMLEFEIMWYKKLQVRLRQKAEEEGEEGIYS